MVDKKPERTDVVLKLFGKRQCFTNQAGTALTKGIVETLNMIGQASFFADRTMAFGRKDDGVGLPKVGVEDSALPICRRQ